MENHSICDTVAPSSLTEGCLHWVKPLKTMADLLSFGLDVGDELSSAIEESFGIANCERDERKQGLYILFGFGCVQFPLLGHPCLVYSLGLYCCSFGTLSPYRNMYCC